MTTFDYPPPRKTPTRALILIPLVAGAAALLGCSTSPEGAGSNGTGTAGESSVGSTGTATGGPTLTSGGVSSNTVTGGGATSSGSTTSTSGGETSSTMGGTVSTGAESSTSSGSMTSSGTSAGGATSTSTNAEGAGGTSAGGAPSTSAGTTAGTDDRCELGVYDPNKPPRVITSSNTPGTHDPAVIEADGTFYLFATGIGAWTSTDLTNWRNGGPVFGVPDWMRSAVSGVGNLWAPDISYFGGQYHIYYAGSVFGKNTSCIGHATRESMSSGSWTDQGSPTICSNISAYPEQNVNWNAIDPNVIIDTDGNPWLDFGSFWDGIELIPLDESGERVGTTVTNVARRSRGGPEGPFIVHRCEYYYLFTSWDTCCQGANSTYNIRVARSETVDGPFVDQEGTPALEGGGTLIAEGDGSYAGPGGQSVLFTSDNKAYLVYHAYTKPSGAVRLRIADLVWDSEGWPVPVGP